VSAGAPLTPAGFRRQPFAQAQGRPGPLRFSKAVQPDLAPMAGCGMVWFPEAEASPVGSSVSVGQQPPEKAGEWLWPTVGNGGSDLED
jgi:hypothetical protein